ncbi:MAG: rhomboid family intramembrane serine protease, partial [Candidatus Omnitrophica bacterium]|nr:rhomboid family intramembrane serine protease [Candidatus Omnitrophota bacterium]
MKDKDMLPLRDENPTIHTSFATFFLVGINILSWFFIQGFGFTEKFITSVCRFGLIPIKLFGSIPEGTTISLSHNLICSLDKNFGWITLITSMFMHGSWFHIITNMWFLSVFG